MILDSSAVVTVLRREEGYQRYASALEEAADPAIGAPTLLETEIVAIRRFGPAGRERVARFLDHYGIAVIPFDSSHRYAATDAFLRYGKGRHPARLNLGDCMTYATAYIADHPLLFTGNDFAQTDISVALG